MKIYDIPLRQRLDEVKRSEKGKEVFVCPDDLANDLHLFLQAYGIEYRYNEHPEGYTIEQIRKYLKPYRDIDWCPDAMVFFETPFDKKALFQWTLQLFGDGMDPAFAAYMEDEERESYAYYLANEKDEDD